jgi:hypothetical protein
VPRGAGRETDMSPQDNEQLVLDAIESQLRAEDPDLIGCFSDFASIAPPVRPVNGWGRAGRGRKVAPCKSWRHATPIRVVLAAAACVLATALAAAAVFTAMLGAAAIWLRPLAGLVRGTTRRPERRVPA